MRRYDKDFKAEAVMLSDRIGVKKAAGQLGVPYCSLAEWREKRKASGQFMYFGFGFVPDGTVSDHERQMILEIEELKKSNEILKEALRFYSQNQSQPLP